MGGASPSTKPSLVGAGVAAAEEVSVVKVAEAAGMEEEEEVTAVAAVKAVVVTVVVATVGGTVAMDPATGEDTKADPATRGGLQRGEAGGTELVVAVAKWDFVREYFRV